MDKGQDGVVVVGQMDEQPVSMPDFEFMVIATCIDAFAKIDRTAVRRILRYLQDRYSDQAVMVPGEAKPENPRGSRKN